MMEIYVKGFLALLTTIVIYELIVYKHKKGLEKQKEKDNDKLNPISFAY